MDSINFIEKSPKMEVIEKSMDFETKNNLNIVVDNQVPSTSMETIEYDKNSYFIDQ